MKSYKGTGYKALFECIKELGIEAVINYMEGLKYIEQNSLKGTESYFKLREMNRVVKEYVDKNESITLINPASRLLAVTLRQLSENISLLESYLENARRIEALKVRKVDFLDCAEGEDITKVISSINLAIEAKNPDLLQTKLKDPVDGNRYRNGVVCSFMRSNPKVDGHIIESENPQHISDIRKFYTDGKIKPVAYAGFFFGCDSSTQSDWYKMTNFEKLFNTIYLNANEDPNFYKRAEKRYATRAHSPRLSISDEYLFLKISQASFVLSAYLDPKFCDLTMRVKDFNFDGSKLPTEEEVQKLEVPKQYRKEISKKANYIVSKAIGKDAL